MTNANIDQAADDQIPDQVVLSGLAVAQVAELLEHCYAFFLDDDRSLNELRAYCLGQRENVTALWVVDHLAWHAVLLRLQLAEQAAEDRDRHG